MPDTTEITYLIDAVGRRIGKKMNGTEQRKYVYLDQINPVAEYDASGGMVAYYVYGTRGHVPDYMVRSGETYRIISDHLGSVRMVVNTADSTVAQRMDFDEFGNVLTDTNPGFQPFSFAGGLYDPDTQLTRFGYRDYDPETGRWLAKDPIGFGGGQVNLYVYCNNCPIMFIDPSGLFLHALMPAHCSPAGPGIMGSKQGNMQYAASVAGTRGFIGASGTAIYTAPTLGMSGVYGVQAIAANAQTALIGMGMSSSEAMGMGCIEAIMVRWGAIPIAGAMNFADTIVSYIQVNPNIMYRLLLGFQILDDMRSLNTIHQWFYDKFQSDTGSVETGSYTGANK